MTLSAGPEMVSPGHRSSYPMRLLRLGWQDWADVLRAMWHLAQARYVLHRINPREFRPFMGADQPLLPCPIAPSQLDRIVRAIARGARVVPWRSDCLVQAEAGRRWIAGLGGVAEIRLGACKGPNGDLAAHAWLLCAGRVVTGGDISRFVPFA